jgi:hypothetical protein
MMADVSSSLFHLVMIDPGQLPDCRQNENTGLMASEDTVLREGRSPPEDKASLRLS